MSNSDSVFQVGDLETTKYPFQKVKPKRGMEIAVLLGLLKEFGVGCFVAGGFARWMVSNEEHPPAPDDIDIYFDGSNSFALAEKWFRNKGFELKLESKNAITFAPPAIAAWQDCLHIQLIKPSYDRCGEISHVLLKFDLSVCQAAVEIKDGQAVGYCSYYFLDDNDKKTVRILHISNPLLTMQRCCKYACKGYRIPPREMMKILANWEERSEEVRDKFKKLVSSGDYKEVYDLLDLM